MTAPRLDDRYIPHTPHPGPQQVFLCTDDYLEVFYGGAAGGGKSDALLMAALQYVDVPGYAALLLRRTWKDLSQPGAIMDRAYQWLKNSDATPVSGGRSWTFPSGARLVFGYAMYHKDVENQFTSAEYQFIGIDELTRGWERRTYDFLFSRIRKPSYPCLHCRKGVMRYDGGWAHRDPDTEEELPALNPHWGCPKAQPDPDAYERAPDGTALPDVPLRMRTASNPGGTGHRWVKQLFVDPVTRRPGAVFVPASLDDNPSLNRAQYIKSLEHLGAVERERLLRGDWEVTDEGTMFRRSWFRTVPPEAVPADCEWVRYWDLAATNPNHLKKGGDPDWSSGALVGLSRSQGTWWIADMQRIQGTPFEVERLIAYTLDRDEDRGLRGIRYRMELEPGSAGLSVVDHYRRGIFVGKPFDGHRPSGPKPERATGWSAAAEAGNVALVRGAWIDEFLDEVELFPIGPHDDQVDAVSGAVYILTSKKKARLVG